MTDKKSTVITGILMLILLMGAVCFHTQVSMAVLMAGKRCLVSVLPSLYFFSILAAFSVQSGLLEMIAQPFQKLCRKFLKTDAVLLMIVFFSQIGGYPVGAQLVHGLYQEGRISEQQEQKLINVCMGCGFGFLLATVGGNSRSVFLIWLMISVPDWLFALFMIRDMMLPEITGTSRKAPALCLTASVENAATAMMKILSMILAFSAVMGVAEGIFPDPGDLIRSILEISNAGAYAQYGGLPMTAALLSFGGICVHLQIAAICENHLSWWKFWLCRIMMAMLTHMLCIICLKYMIPMDQPVFLSETVVSSTEGGNLIPGSCLLIMSVFVLKKYHFFQKSLTNLKK